VRGTRVIRIWKIVQCVIAYYIPVRLKVRAVDGLQRRKIIKECGIVVNVLSCTRNARLKHLKNYSPIYYLMFYPQNTNNDRRENNKQREGGEYMHVTTLINEYIINPYVEGDRVRTAYYPSEASAIDRSGNVVGKCLRATYYDWTGQKPTNPIDMRGWWTFELGKKIEQIYTEKAKECGIWAGNNVKFYDKIHNISGEVDIFIFNGSHTSANIEGVEIKTAYGYGFQKQVTSAPKPENLMQIMLYIAYFGYPWHLVYKARDTQEDIEYIVTLDKDDKGTHAIIDSVPYKAFYLEDIYARYEKLGEHIMLGTEPPQDYQYAYDLSQSERRYEMGEITKTKLAQVKNGKTTDSDWRCLYCSHLDRCWADKRKQMKLK
jgi:hypothetical protein